MASVTLSGLTKTFEGAARAAVRDLSLEVRDGELLVLLGPSGCGKTTVLRCIAGLEDPTAGDVHIGERVVTHLPPAQRDVAMVFQSYALYPHLTVRENIGFALEMRGVPQKEIDTRVTDTARRLGLAELLDRRPEQLSGGQRQRVAVARAIVRAPQVFLFDEPLSNLDAPLRIELRAELLALHRALRATMVYVTHDPVEAMTLGQRIAVLHEGRLRQVGTPADVYERPADVFVARAVGGPPMNVLEGRARGGRDRVVEVGSLVIPVNLADYEGELHLGIRPEHVGLCGVEQGVGDADVLVVEPRGSETIVHLNVGGQPLVARLLGLVDVQVGTRVGVKVDRGHLHLFDAAGMRIS
ncbi:MAG TPA: ABC transporter ATP-binding protein [Gemmatimonadales bacterium]|jgi:multiple sugar transport system ATP-binding protein|nr:ABC transporter ATP-binding protein [Gemmatimonadales bacterium]